MNNWTTQIDKITDSFVTTFGNLNSEQLNWKPDPQSWSIAQNIDHLIETNQSYFPVLASLKDGTYKTPLTGKFGFLVNFFGKMILNAVKPDRKKKVKTFPVWQPATGNIDGDILLRFKNHQAELKEQIAGSKELLENRAVISSPANRNIVYRIDKAFDILVLHELRHFEQAKEVQQQMTTGTASS